MKPYVNHYFVGVDGLGPMQEVTLEEWCRYENRAGFRSKSGPGTPATGGFSGGGISGSIRTAKMIRGKQMCVEGKHPIRECDCYPSKNLTWFDNVVLEEDYFA